MATQFNQRSKIMKSTKPTSSYSTIYNVETILGNSDVSLKVVAYPRNTPGVSAPVVINMTRVDSYGEIDYASAVLTTDEAMSLLAALKKWESSIA
jgi:hypothetical protein